jgi:membrane-associated phospholipid phosphatase
VADSGGITNVPPRLLWLAVAAGALVFTLVWADVAFEGAATRLDERVVQAVRDGVSRDTRLLFENILSAPGHDPAMAATAILGAAVCLWWRAWRNALVLLGGTGLGAGIVWTLKDAIGRVRPSGDAHSFAFPSGHTSGTTIVYGLAIALLWHAYWNRPGAAAPAAAAWRTRRQLVAAWASLALVAGASRVLGGVHWPTDVLAGWGLGLTWLALMLLAHQLTERLLARQAQKVAPA